MTTPPASGLRCALLAVALVLAGPVLADHGGEAEPGSPPVSSEPSALEALRQLGLDWVAGAADDEFLHPDQAFVLSSEVRDPVTLVVRWDIADAYYLYRDKMKFALSPGQGVRTGDAALRRGEVKEDPYFGRQEVFYGAAEAVIPLQRSIDTGTEVTVDVTYQGCADAGLCYPPITKTVALRLPP